MRRVRPLPPHTPPGFLEHLDVGDKVDFHHKGGWWPVEVVSVRAEDNEGTFEVEYRLGEEPVPHSIGRDHAAYKLRPSWQECRRGHWILKGLRAPPYSHPSGAPPRGAIYYDVISGHWVLESAPKGCASSSQARWRAQKKECCLTPGTSLTPFGLALAHALWLALTPFGLHHAQQCRPPERALSATFALDSRGWGWQTGRGSRCRRCRA